MSVDHGSKKDRMAEEADLGRSDLKHNKFHTTGQIQIVEISRAFPKKHLSMSLLVVHNNYTGERNRRGCETL